MSEVYVVTKGNVEMAVVYDNRKQMIDESIERLEQLKETTNFDVMNFETFKSLYLALTNAESIMEKKEIKMSNVICRDCKHESDDNFNCHKCMYEENSSRQYADNTIILYNLFKPKKVFCPTCGIIEDSLKFMQKYCRYCGSELVEEGDNKWKNQE